MFEVEFKIFDYSSESYVDFSSHLVFPSKVGEFLDERLDEYELQLERMSAEIFKPFTPCILKIKTQSKTIKASSPINAQKYIAPNGETGDVVIVANLDGTYSGHQEWEIKCFVSDDSVSQTPRGILTASNNLVYTHTMRLVEMTKLMERFMCDSITFTNPLGSEIGDVNALPNIISNPSDYIQGTLIFNIVKSRIQIGSIITIPVYDVLKAMFNENSLNDFTPKTLTDGGVGFYFSTLDFDGFVTQAVLNCKIYDPDGNERATQEVYWNPSFTGTNDIYNKYNITLTIPNKGYMYIKYDLTVIRDNVTYHPVVAFYAYETTTKYPLKKWTCKDVCERIFDLAEPLSHNGISPRFSLQQGIESYLDEIIAPEFSMTKMTMREQLQMVGRFIHCEPRITDMEWDTTNKRWTFEVGFDLYGNETKSNISTKMEVSDQVTINGEAYATRLDTNVENLTSQLDLEEGSTIEPYGTGEITLRSESVTSRLDDSENAHIATEFPIYSVAQLLCTGYGKRESDGTITWTDFSSTSYGKPADITEFIFEQSDYNNLDTFNSIINQSRSIAIYYTQGNKGIRGLFFKQTSMMNAYQDYAIINILKATTGLDIRVLDYPLLKFRIVYLPLSSARLVTNRLIATDGIHITTPYNQGANIVESKWFGLNLKGTMAKLGNVDKVKTYKLSWLGDIPRAGTKFDDEYYISSVVSEIMPTCVLCTLGLSKNFNKLSEYVGISTNKRMWEVSERQVSQRESVLHTRAILSYTNRLNKTIIAYGQNPFQIFLWNSRRQVIGAVTAYAKEQGNNAPIQIGGVVAKAVSCVPLGNSLCFTLTFTDNYSAGQQVSYIDDTSHPDVKGFWGNYAPYTDFYGRVYYFQIGLVVPKAGFDPLSYPVENSMTWDYYALITEKIKYRKDSRETPRITIELDAVSDDVDIIIGSGLASNSGYIRTPKALKSVWLSRKLNKLDNTIEQDSILKEDVFYYNGEQNIAIPFAQKTGTAENAVAWALITERGSVTIDVSNEDGTNTIQTISIGGELVLGSNRLYDDEGNEIDTIYSAFIDTTTDKI